jgi:glucose/arabinose dehydrogenase
VAMVTPGDKSSRLFVVEQGGRIISFDNSDDTSTSRVFLDISSRIANGGELGLLGLAFHPSFSSNGKFYINYTESRPEDASKYRSVISVFTLTTPFAETASNANEERLLVIDQPFSNHNGGDLAFGKDGYLYIAMGDGGSGGDPLGHAQNKGSLLGKILRIDVDSKTDTLTYGIPRSNPFWRNKSGYREEIFAYGLRNPFRMSFDRVTGNLWVGDVGQGAREEINIVSAGGNYGWNLREGSLCYPPGSSCKGSNFIRPITEYGRDEGRSVIGGYVYRGKSIPRLAGTYLYADFISGKIFGLVYDGNRAETETLLDTGLLISSFGQDNKKELYLLSYQEGKIYRIVSD